ncbi:GIN domain-containing protein [Lactobacillus helsingborgensis]|uniref:GIN domain-containing protein n=1 Tax=Lactobacillus helsingborgensis TaxID=1218494 RepID=UPI002264087C|nr:DUF2807 domain-containing protein [Lactobacillus helsingborgensis]UZX32466.1 DUF2807 domain-containing protein [Lactobacillus helsingborgensis]
MKRQYKTGIFLGIIGGLLFTSIKINGLLQTPQVTDVQATQTIKRVQTVKKFNKIKFSSYRPHTVVTLGNKYQVLIRAKRGGDIKQIKTKVKNKQLIIYDKPEKHFDNSYYDVTVTVPDKNVIKKVSGHLRRGSVLVQKLNVPIINLKSDTAYVALDHVSSQNIKLKTKQKPLDIMDSNLKNSSISVGKGNIGILNSKIKTKIFIAKGGVLVTDCNFLGNSTFTLNKGVFLMTGSPKISYDLRVDSKHKIETDTKDYHKRFFISVPSKPTVKVISKNANIQLFK